MATKKRQQCEVFSRSMGFIRPIKNFNIGKKQEFEERNTFKENIIFRTLKSLFKEDVPRSQEKNQKNKASQKY